MRCHFLFLSALLFLVGPVWAWEQKVDLDEPEFMVGSSDVLLLRDRGSIAGLSPGDGRILWQLRAVPWNADCGVLDGRLAVVDRDGRRLRHLDLKEGEKKFLRGRRCHIGPRGYWILDRSGVRVFAPDGSERFTHETTKPLFEACPGPDGGWVVTGGNLCSLNRKGEVRWQREVPEELREGETRTLRHALTADDTVGLLFDRHLLLLEAPTGETEALIPYGDDEWTSATELLDKSRPRRIETKKGIRFVVPVRADRSDAKTYRSGPGLLLVDPGKGRALLRSRGRIKSCSGDVLLMELFKKGKELGTITLAFDPRRGKRRWGMDGQLGGLVTEKYYMLPSKEKNQAAIRSLARNRHVYTLKGPNERITGDGLMSGRDILRIRGFDTDGFLIQLNEKISIVCIERKWKKVFSLPKDWAVTDATLRKDGLFLVTNDGQVLSVQP